VLLLFETARFDEMHTAVVHMEHGTYTPVHLREFFEDRSVLHRSQPEATIRFRNQAIEQMMFPEFWTQHVKGDELVTFYLWDEGIDVTPQKILHVLYISAICGLSRENHNVSVPGTVNTYPQPEQGKVALA
jgi:hypothetical protein